MLTNENLNPSAGAPFAGTGSSGFGMIMTIITITTRSPGASG